MKEGFPAGNIYTRKTVGIIVYKPRDHSRISDSHDGLNSTALRPSCWGVGCGIEIGIQILILEIATQSPVISI